MHAVTRATLAACAVIGTVGIAGTGLAAVIGAFERPAAPAPAPVVQKPQAGTGLEPRLTQRKGEWSPLCATTQEPLIDFSPVDRGTLRHRILLTVHNCSREPVEIGEPLLWLGGREGHTDYLRLDAEQTQLTPTTLEPWTSATAVFTWEADGVAVQQPDDTGLAPLGRGVLSVRIPGIGEGELQDERLDIGFTTRAWLSGWTPA